ncbi:MAG: hypothetical protein ACKO5E_22330, partial [bacterium]
MNALGMKQEATSLWSPFEFLTLRNSSLLSVTDRYSHLPKAARNLSVEPEKIRSCGLVFLRLPGILLRDDNDLQNNKINS